MQITRDIKYSAQAGQFGHIDRYCPARPAVDRPPMLLIHGGGWQSLSKEGIGHIARFIIKRIEIEVWCPNYRLLPGASWPAPLDDCKAAAQFVLQETSAKSIILAGGSAGAHLAMLTGFELPRSQVHGILSYGGPSVLEQRGRLIRPLFRPTSIRRLFGAALDEPDAHARLNPAFHPKVGPPLALVHSRRDLLVPPAHAHLMRYRYRIERAPCCSLEFDGPGIHHGGWLIRKNKSGPPALSRPFKDALRLALRFLYRPRT